MTGGLVAFLRARLDEDEAQVRDHLCINCGVTTAPLQSALGITGYTHDGTDPVWQGRRCPGSITGAVPVQRPQRVLAEVDAKRRMLEEYSKTVQLRDEADARIKAAWPASDAKDLDTWNRAQREAAIMHDWVLLLALPYRDHPAYQPDWAPSEG